MIASPRHVCAGAWMFGVLIGLVLLAQSTIGLDWQATASAARQVPAWVWCVFVLGWGLSLVLRAWRLQREWGALRDVDFVQCLRLVVLHGAALMAMPIRIGEVGYVYLVHHHWQVTLGRAVRSLVWMRWQDATILTSLGIALIAPMPASSRMALALAVLTLGVVVIPQLGPGALAHVAPARRWRGAVTDHPLDIDGWTASFANWLVRLGALALLLLQMTGTANETLPLGVSAGIEMSTMLPVQGVGGLGTYEGGAWLAARLGGGNVQAFVGAALVAHLVSVCLTVIAVLVARRGGVSAAPLRTCAPQRR